MEYANYKNVALVKYDMYTDNFNKVYNLIKKKYDEKPTPRLSELLFAMHQIAVYVNSIEIDLNASDRIISDTRLAKNRAIERARKSEARVEELEKKLNFKL